MCIMFRDKWIIRFFKSPFCGDFSLHLHEMVQEISRNITRAENFRRHVFWNSLMLADINDSPIKVTGVLVENKSIVLFCLIFFSQIWKKNREIMPVKTVTSPSSTPQVTFLQATRGVSNENGLSSKTNGTCQSEFFVSCISTMPC